MPSFDQTRLEKTTRLFHQCLFDSDEGQVARDFIINDRKLDLEMLRPYEIGFCPPDILYPDSNELVVDGHMWYMRGRLVFTIRDLFGKVMAFNGRMIPACSDDLWISLNDQKGDRRASELHEKWSSRKWVNEEFVKGNHLYRLYDTHREILRTGTAVLVEGCMDAVVMTSFGITNCVSVLGTKLTPVHEGLLRRFADHLVFCFDGDQAGEKTRSSLGESFGDHINMKNLEMTTSAVVLRNKMDPEEALLDEEERPLFLHAISELSDGNMDQRVIDLGDDKCRAALMWEIDGWEM